MPASCHVVNAALTANDLLSSLFLFHSHAIRRYAFNVCQTANFFPWLSIDGPQPALCSVRHTVNPQHPVTHNQCPDPR
ncbi:hypothetical protein BCR44DRAFT_1221558 [Catenaria anguillulae PL171]|uniref:Uncharacterized protein n=1 Tax=Catenaria anguillulae PL171 TaxID=765915 RepID=A0A1Y2HZR1_9FUNG|nr:hypothetical protein BCR44DRAFT_1221558 [Catenaria anguillulae PL171]